MNQLVLKTCPYAKECGGCQYQGIPYFKQLLIKQDKVNSLLSSFCRVNKIIGMENPYFYRHKIQAAFKTDRRKNIICGTYQTSTHRVVDIDRCQIQEETADKIVQTIKGLMKDFKLSPFDEDRLEGFLRHVQIRYGYHSKQIMVILVTGSFMFPSKKDFVKALIKLHPDITTIIHNVNKRKTSMILGEKSEVLYGKGKIEDQLFDYRFMISPTSFYQINPQQTEVLYQTALDYANLSNNMTLLDAYCGTGTIGILASKKVKEVIGVELNKEAIKDAIANAKLNNIDNIDFVNADAAKYMLMMAQNKKNLDVVIVDPPRKGCEKTFLDALIQVAPKSIVYISCNPVTLANDLAVLSKHYDVKKIQPVDMFPFTEHVETVVLMSRVEK